jgi:pimeloyl-ACP methyl ester carboxylesterase
MNGDMTWAGQRPLEDRWTLIVPDRRGYFPNPPAEREDFEVDAGDIVEILDAEGGAHVVGHSYGGVIALLAAARRPAAVRSLTVIEPPAFGLVADDPAVKPGLEKLKALFASGPEDPEEFLRVFVGSVGSAAQLPSPLPPPLLQNARLAQVERPPWEARIPLDDLRAAALPKMVVSGGHSAMFDAVCDVLERDLSAQRAVIPGAGHSVPRTGAAFNERLERFLREAS